MRGSKTYSSVWMNSMRFVTLSLASWKSCGSRTGPARLYTRVSGPERANSCTAVSTAFTTRNLPAAPAGSPRAARAAAAANRRRSQTLCTRRQPPPSRASYVRDCVSWNFAIAGLSASVGVMLVRARRRPSAAPQYRSLSQHRSAPVSRAAERAHHPGNFPGLIVASLGYSLGARQRLLTHPLNFSQKRGFPLIAAIGQMRVIVASFCQISMREKSVPDDLLFCGSGNGRILIGPKSSIGGSSLVIPH